MLKILTITAASIAMLSAAAAADLPRKEPPPPAAPVGKAPIGKYPVGKAPIGKYPQPVAAQGLIAHQCVRPKEASHGSAGNRNSFVGTSARRMHAGNVGPRVRRQLHRAR